MERSEGQASGAGYRRLNPLAEPTYKELRETGIQMGWAIRGRGKAKTRGITPLRFSGQNLGAFLEHGKPPLFFCLNQHVTCGGLVCYKRAFIVDSSIAYLLFKACTIFIIGEAHEGVRFLMRQSLWTPKQQ
jgi:hypothetical protein